MQDAKNARYTFGLIDELPTIEDLQAMNIGPYEGSEMDIYILAYLVLYAEEECIDEESDEWRYIYEPDETLFTQGELEAFSEARKYIQKTIIKRVERIPD